MSEIWLVKVWRITDNSSNSPSFPATKHSSYTVTLSDYIAIYIMFINSYSLQIKVMLAIILTNLLNSWNILCVNNYTEVEEAVGHWSSKLKFGQAKQLKKHKFSFFHNS